MRPRRAAPARIGWVAAATLVGVTLAPAALGQHVPTEPDPRTESPLRAGDFVFHPALALDLGYDSNFARAAPSEGVEGALRLRLRPSFALATADLGPGTVERRGYALRVDVEASYREMRWLESPDEAPWEGIPLRRDLEGAVRAALELAPDRDLSGTLKLGLARTTRPNNEGDLAVNESRLAPEAAAGLGATLDHGRWDLGVAHRVTGTIFEDDALRADDALLNGSSLTARWHVARSTALLGEAGLGVTSYLHGADAGAGAPSAPKSTSYQLRARLGVAHLLTRRVGLVGLAGWGSGLYAGSLTDFHSVIGGAELRFFLEPLVESDPVGTGTPYVAVGFERDFEDSYLGSYLARSQGYARLSALFAGRYSIVAELLVGAVAFPATPLPSAAIASSWVDTRVDLTLTGEWRPVPWLGLDAGVTYGGYASEQVIDPGGPAEDPLSYQEVTVFFGQRVFW
ncbi:MAG: hypothetical protein IT373_17150 [Polyangiaceae bacterium]|nr:hypothetical protein [Polyangiaceae bacterium]